MGAWNILRPGKRWADYLADLERIVMSKPPEERARLFGVFRGLGALLMGLPEDVGGALYDAIVVSLPKFGPGHNSHELWQKAQAAAPRLIAAIRSYAAEENARAGHA